MIKGQFEYPVGAKAVGFSHGPCPESLDLGSLLRLLNQTNRVTFLQFDNLTEPMMHKFVEGVAMIRFRFAVLPLLVVSLLSISWLQKTRADDDASRTPVLIELFTSEGCSDCPPADALLQKMDRAQPISGTELVVLSEHVDYWDDIGWKDPYSSREYSERQNAYAEHFGLDNIYTPQMVVDGRFEFVGSDERRAIQAIQTARQGEKSRVFLSSIRLADNDTIALHVKVDALPSSAADSADILIATADDSDESNVSRGENAGRTLKHVAVLRTLTRVGAMDQSNGFSGDVTVKIHRANSQYLRIVAIIQEARAGRVWGVASARLSR